MNQEKSDFENALTAGSSGILPELEKINKLILPNKFRFNRSQFRFGN